MAWFSRITRFGDVHWVFGQEREISCGVACAIMAAFKINKLVPGTKAIFDEDTVLEKAVGLLGPNPLGASGLSTAKLVQLLNHPDLKMPGWRHEQLAPGAVPRKLIDIIGVTNGFGLTINSKPAVVGIDWKGGGGHWVLVDSIRSLIGKKYATVCDPWDANVHVTSLQTDKTLLYTGKAAPKVDLWGQHHEYNAPSEGGAFIGDVIYRA